MLNTSYQRKNNNSPIINQNHQSKIINNYSWSNYTKAGLAIAGTVGTVALAKTTGFLPSFSWSSNETILDNSLDNSYQLINSQETIMYSDNSFQSKHRHAKRGDFGEEFLVGSFASPQDGLALTSVAMLSTDEIVVVWVTNNIEISGRLLSDTGIPQNNTFQINTYTTDWQYTPSVAVINTGDFVVVWQSLAQDGSNEGIYGQLFSSTGVPQGSEFQINTYTTGSQSYPSVAALSTGDFVVVWQSSCLPTPCNGQDGANEGIYGQRFSSAGAPQDNEFQVNTYTSDSQLYSSVAALTTGDFVVVWQSDGQDGGALDSMGFNHGIYGQRFSSAGVPQGNEFQINTYTDHNQKNPSATALTTGDFVVVWESSCLSSCIAQNGGLGGIYGQRFSNTGVPQGSEFQVSTENSVLQWIPSVNSLSSGDFVVVWQSGMQVYGRIFFNVNMQPNVANNVLVINSAFPVVLSTINLNAYDPDNADSELTFSMSNILYGQFERVSNAGAAITSFTQQEIIDDTIQFVHDGSANQPSYEVSVNDGALTDGPLAANVSFVHLAKNQLVVQPSEAIVLGAEQLDIQTQMVPSDLELSVVNVQYGHFEKNDGSWVVITLFDLSELRAGNIRFVHDGTENSPLYILQLKDLASGLLFPQQIIGNTILNHAPQVPNPIGVISKQINEFFSYTLPNNVFVDPDVQLLQITVTPVNGTVFPAWISFDNLTTTLSGTPVTVGSYPFIAIATDPYDATASSDASNCLLPKNSPSFSLAA